MLSYVKHSDDKFKETGITRGMVNRMIPAWNKAIEIGNLSRAIQEAKSAREVHLLRHRLAFLRGDAKTDQCPGDCNGYDWSK